VNDTLVGALIGAVATIVVGALGAITVLIGEFIKARADKRRHEGEQQLDQRDRRDSFMSERQAAYVSYLTLAHRFHQDASRVEPFGKPAATQAWLRQFEHARTIVGLLGTVEVWGHAKQLATVIGKAMGEAPEYTQDRERQFLETWDALLTAMRNDIQETIAA
jgi:hypothetical protein